MISIAELYQIYLQYPTVITDTRKITPESLFFCLKGEKFDGNTFAKTALENGARFAVVDDPSLEGTPGLLLVDNVLNALQQLAHHHRQQLHIPVIGITGTNGKTTTKELIIAVLSKKYRVVGTQGNLNNHIGVPLTLLTIKNDTQIAVIEMGANHPGEIEDLCNITLPDAGLITNIGKAHLEGFGSIENIIETKTALYRSVQHQGGPVFINASNPTLLAKAGGLIHYLYGDTENCYCRGRLIAADPFVALEWGNGHQVLTKLAGAWNVDNMLAAICIGTYYRVSDADINDALGSYTPTNMRSQVKITERNTILLDAYNANPTSMQAAINHFSNGNREHKVLIIGDMLELGTQAEAEHLQVLEMISSLHFAEVFLVGAQFGKIIQHPEYTRFTNTEAAISYFKAHPLQGKNILIKGSRGIGLERIVEYL